MRLNFGRALSRRVVPARADFGHVARHRRAGPTISVAARSRLHGRPGGRPGRRWAIFIGGSDARHMCLPSSRGYINRSSFRRPSFGSNLRDQHVLVPHGNLPPGRAPVGISPSPPGVRAASNAALRATGAAGKPSPPGGWWPSSNSHLQMRPLGTVNLARLGRPLFMNSVC